MKVSSRFIKLSGILLMTVAAVVLATALFLPYLLDINAYRAEIVSALQQKLNRPVSFSSGSFAWNFGPSFEFKDFTVKERDGSSDFITARQITVTMSLIPLLEKRVELQSLIMDGTTVSLLRNRDGTYNIDDLLKTERSEVQVLFKNVRMSKGTFLWKDMTGGTAPFTAALRNISCTADHLVRGQKGHLKFIADIPAVSGAPTRIAFSGGIRLPAEGRPLSETALDCEISLKQAEIARFWPYFGKYIPFENSGGRLDFTSRFKGKHQDFSAKGNIVLSGATVKWPTVFHATLSPKVLKLEYTLALTNQLIDVSTVDVSMEGFRIKGNFRIQDYLTKDPRIIARASTPSTFRYEDIRNYVPYEIIDRDTADYIENKIKAGIFKLDTGILDGRVSQIAHMEIGENYNTLFIRGPVEKGILSYGPGAPTFNNLKGIIELKGKSFNLVGMTGNFGTSPFSLNSSIVEYNTDKPSDYPIVMDISPRASEMAWLAKIAGIPELEYSNSSSLHLVGSGHHTAYRLNGDWDLKQADYELPGYVDKPLSMPQTLKFNSVIGKESTKITSVAYQLQQMTITGSGLIGYGDKPYLGFDLHSNRFEMNEALPILSMWQKYKIKGAVQADIRGGGDPADMSAMDYFGTVNLTRVNFLPSETLKRVSGVTGLLTFQGNSLESSTIAARYGTSVVTVKAGIKSLKNPEGDITLSSPQFYMRDLDLAEDQPDAAIKRFNAAITLRKHDIPLHRISGLINTSNFSLNGVYTFGRNRDKADISVTSSKLDLDDLLLFSTSSQNSGNQKNNGLDIKMTLSAEEAKFGKFTFNTVNAATLQENGSLYLQNMTAGISDGTVTAKGRIGQGSDQKNRYDLTFDVSRADAEKFFSEFSFSHDVKGTLSFNGSLTAQGNTLLDAKKSALGNIRISLNNGSLRKFNTLAKVFSILNVSQLLKFKLPDMASGGIPYSSIKGSLSVKDGTVSTQDLFMTSNAINVSVIGNVDIVKEELHLTIGAQPLQTVDKVVNRIPIVGWLLTGKDKNVVTAYFEAKGKWSNPQVNAIQVKSMGKGILNIFGRIFQLPVKLFTDTGEVILGN
jgi:uncharacterized protein involved in outer membrane biogenesis